MRPSRSNPYLQGHVTMLLLVVPDCDTAPVMAANHAGRHVDAAFDLLVAGDAKRVQARWEARG